MKNFLIISQPYTGSSLLMSIFDQHAGVDMWFENDLVDTWYGKQAKSRDENLMWGNKIIIEFSKRREQWDKVQAVMKDYKIIINVRSLKGHILKFKHHKAHRFTEEEAVESWQYIRDLYARLVDEGYDVAINELEDLLEDPYKEGARLMEFLGLEYSEEAIYRAPRHNRHDFHIQPGYDKSDIIR